jgi:hypothetical protein
MGLLNARNLRKAKDLLDKNRHKVGGIVDKAGEKIDKVSGGKTSNVTAKAAEAAKKYSAGGGTSGYSTQVPVDNSQFHSGAPVDPAVSQAQANAASAAAAAAIANAANAAANLMNNAAVQAQIAQAQQAGTVDGKVQATHDPTGGKDHGADWADDHPSN